VVFNVFAAMRYINDVDMFVGNMSFTLCPFNVFHYWWFHCRNVGTLTPSLIILRYLELMIFAKKY
jgi:hypothetical protein